MQGSLNASDHATRQNAKAETSHTSSTKTWNTLEDLINLQFPPGKVTMSDEEHQRLSSLKIANTWRDFIKLLNPGKVVVFDRTQGTLSLYNSQCELRGKVDLGVAELYEIRSIFISLQGDIYIEKYSGSGSHMLYKYTKDGKMKEINSHFCLIDFRFCSQNGEIYLLGNSSQSGFPGQSWRIIDQKEECNFLFESGRIDRLAVMSTEGEMYLVGRSEQRKEKLYHISRDKEVVEIPLELIGLHQMVLTSRGDLFVKGFNAQRKEKLYRVNKDQEVIEVLTNFIFKRNIFLATNEDLYVLGGNKEKEFELYRLNKNGERQEIISGLKSIDYSIDDPHWDLILWCENTLNQNKLYRINHKGLAQEIPTALEKMHHMVITPQGNFLIMGEDSQKFTRLYVGDQTREFQEIATVLEKVYEITHTPRGDFYIVGEDKNKKLKLFKINKEREVVEFPIDVESKYHRITTTSTGELYRLCSKGDHSGIFHIKDEIVTPLPQEGHAKKILGNWSLTNWISWTLRAIRKADHFDPGPLDELCSALVTWVKPVDALSFYTELREGLLQNIGLTPSRPKDQEQTSAPTMSATSSADVSSLEADLPVNEEEIAIKQAQLVQTLEALSDDFPNAWFSPYLKALQFTFANLRDGLLLADPGMRAYNKDEVLEEQLAQANQAYGLLKDIVPAMPGVEDYEAVFDRVKRALRQLEQLSWEDYVSDQLKVVDDLLEAVKTTTPTAARGEGAATQSQAIDAANPWDSLNTDAQETIKAALYRARTATTLGVALDHNPHQAASGDDAFRLQMGATITRAQALLAKRLVLVEADQLVMNLRADSVNLENLYSGKAMYPQAFRDQFNRDQDAVYNLAVFKAAEKKLRDLERNAQRENTGFADQFHAAYVAQVKAIVEAENSATESQETIQKRITQHRVPQRKGDELPMKRASTSSFAFLNRNADALVNFE